MYPCRISIKNNYEFNMSKLLGIIALKINLLILQRIQNETGSNAMLFCTMEVIHRVVSDLRHRGRRTMNYVPVFTNERASSQPV